MGKTSYQSHEQLTEQITESVKKLAAGNLNTSEIEQLTQNTQALYERTIVIRHKAYELFGEPETTMSQPEEIVIEKKEEPIFDFSQNEPEEKEEIEESMSFDFSEPIKKEIKPVIKPVENENTQSINESIDRSSSLNDTFKSSGSLADRLNNSKIDSLKSAIGINKKFAFISDLFAGSNENYNEAVLRLDTCNSADDAKMILNELSIDNSWDLEHPTAMSFIELVERRF